MLPEAIDLHLIQISAWCSSEVESQAPVQPLPHDGEVGGCLQASGATI